MGETTKLTAAATQKKSLRTTVPRSLVKQFDMKIGDVLDWRLEARNGDLIIVVLPIRNSNRPEH